MLTIVFIDGAGSRWFKFRGAAPNPAAHTAAG